jgi:hypothetical protein
MRAISCQSLGCSQPVPQPVLHPDHLDTDHCFWTRRMDDEEEDIMAMKTLLVEWHEACRKMP